jgi:hypothetical protein
MFLVNRYPPAASALSVWRFGHDRLVWSTTQFAAMAISDASSGH